MKKITALSLLLLMLGVGCSDEGAGIDTGVETPDAGTEPVDSGVAPRPDAGSTVVLPVPSLSNVSPRTGPEGGGTRVTLRGVNFFDPAQVYFGDAPATSVVVLDEVSIAATAPAGPVGPVTVKVLTAGGEAELQDGFTYHKELRLDAVSPARVPEEGGVQVTLTGKGYDADTLVYFDRVPMRGVVVVDETTITGSVPALPPGRPEVRLVNREAEVRRSDLLVVFATPEIAAVAPGYGPITGGARQELSGQGLTDATRVAVGGVTAAGLEPFSDDRVGFEAPALAEGAHDVVVENGDAQDTLPGGYIAYDPNDNTLALLGATPNRASTEGGDELVVVGRGFGVDAQVAVGGVRATVVSITANALVIVVPAGLPVGPTDVEVITNAQTVVGTGLFEVYAPIEVLTVTPDRGPAAGGTAVTVTGAGFVPGVEVRIADVPLTDVVVVSDTELTAVTAAGASGVHDVVVRSPVTRGVLQGGFTFEAPFEVIRIEPTEGSVAGNTYVTVLGRGFVAPVAVSFGGVEGLMPVLENGGVIGVRTQPANTGAVDVLVEAGGESALLPRAFTFYDPRLITGGAWGGPIEGSVNVAVMNFSGDPIPGMVVQLGYDADPRYRAITDANGLATVSSPELRGAQTITAGADGVEFVTFMELNAKNLTMVASPHPQSMPPDAPRSPCPTPVAAPAISGRIFKFKSPLDPVTMPGWQPLVRITYTQANVFSPNPSQPPDQVAFVFADGQAYRITVMRVGSVAVYAVLGDYNPETGAFLPRRMGIARSVPVAPENETTDIDIDLDIPLDQSTLLRLDNPPTQQPGPSINAVFPYLNLGSDGVVPFPAVALQGTGNILVDRLPAVSEAEFIYMAGSFTWDPASGALRNPYSLNLIETAAPFEEGVDMGPYLEMPQNMAPKAGELIEGGALSWDQGGVVPDIATISVVDVRSVSGCCCLDANMNGQCDAGEGEQCGGLPQQFNRWSIYGRGGLQSYVMPTMPSPLMAFEPPRAYAYLLQEAVAPRFNYSEFIYNQFSPFFWKSWNVFSSSFAVKEETD